MNNTPRTLRVCSLEDCNTGGRITKGLCDKHYQRTQKKPNRPAEYLCYCAMKQRCTNPNAKSYYLYGGRGIKICDRWLGKGGFNRMIEDIGHRPSKDYSLNRINVNGNYEPGNVVWAEWFEQANNRVKETDGISYLSTQSVPKRWRARLTYKGTKILNKTYSTYEEAISARKRAEQEYFHKYKVL